MSMDKRNERVKNYFMDCCVETKITGESAEDCNISLWIRIGDFYLETSFVAKQKEIHKWEDKK